MAQEGGIAGSRGVAELTISAVADQTDVSEAGLRSWELRYGFPAPLRLPSGHRRYSATDVAQIREVLADRQSGVSLAAAIARVQARALLGEPSLFAALRTLRPDLPVHVLSPRAMLAITRAIEDECCAKAQRPLLIGSFQRERFFRRSERRWNELARTAAAAVVFAERESRRQSGDGITVVALPAGSVLRREWAIICDGPGCAACLAGFERPGSPPGARRFEAVWCVDPAVVRNISAAGLALAGNLGVHVDVALAPPTSDAAAVAESAAALTSRIIAYLDS